MLHKNSQNSQKKFLCESCDYKCSRKNDMTKHFSSQKHNCNKNGNEEFAKIEFTCNVCNKKYKSRVGLWRHKKTCAVTTSGAAIQTSIAVTTSAAGPSIAGSTSGAGPSAAVASSALATLGTSEMYIKDKDSVMIELLINEHKDFKNIILDLVKSNTDLQKQMVEVCKSSSINTVISNNHSHNKTFNLQFFLNEQCKDAMNLLDFVNSMTLELSDLEEVGTLGYVEGISNIIIRKLNALDIYKRPIHCSDAKREIVYVKEDNVWEKENNSYDKLRKVIKQVTYKNSALLVPWSQKYPNCMNNQHHLNDVYVRMMGQAMGGRESFAESENKIMKKIAKAVLIEK